MWWQRAAVVVLTLVAGLAFIYLPIGWNVVFGGVAIALALAAAALPATQATAIVGAVILAIPLVGAIGTFVGNSAQFARQVGWIKPTYGIGIDHPVVVLGQTAHATFIGSYPNGDKANLDGFQCNWQLSPTLPLPQPNGECVVEIPDVQKMFQTAGPAVVTVSIVLEAKPPNGPAIRIGNPNQYTVTMHNISAPSITISPATLEIGQTASAKIRFLTGVVPSIYTCSWMPPELFQKPDDCDTTFVAPESTGRYRDGGVPVHVAVVTNGLTLKTDEFSVSVQQPPARLYDFVLDATDNMALVNRGVTLFDNARKDIASQIARFGPRGGWLSITAFGHDVPKAANDCDRFGQVYPLTPIKPQAAQTALDGLHMVGHVAPLAKAIDAAVAEYSALRPTYRGKDISSYFVVITAGANGCQNMSLGDAIAEMASTFDHYGLRVQYYSKGFLFSAVVAIRVPGALNPDEVIYRSDYQSDRNRTVIFVADNGEQATDIVGGIVDLSDADPAVRHNGCERLGGYLVKGDKNGYTLLKQQCGT
jgi:hypothetical protein